MRDIKHYIRALKPYDDPWDMLRCQVEKRVEEQLGLSIWHHLRLQFEDYIMAQLDEFHEEHR